MAAVVRTRARGNDGTAVCANSDIRYRESLVVQAIARGFAHWLSYRHERQPTGSRQLSGRVPIGPEGDSGCNVAARGAVARLPL
jgi:hypothetical protein